jgi:hypothetical protein
MGKRVFHRQGAKEDKFSEFKTEGLVFPWQLGG